MSLEITANSLACEKPVASRRGQLWQKLKAQPSKASSTNSVETDKLYKHWRMRSLYGAFVGYAIFYFCRKNLSAATPVLIQDLGISKTVLGSLWSALYLTYAVGKFVNGVLGDRANCRYFMALGLVLSAVCNFIFGLSSSVIVLGICWGLNGWFQSMGGPTCARIMTNWFSPNELGTKWGLWNISHQVGGGVILILGGYLAQNYGWRSAFIIPGVIAVITAVFLVNRLRDTPESMGLPPIEVYRQDFTHGVDAELNTLHGEKDALKDLVWRRVLSNPSIWFLAISNFFVYIVRYGAMDWAPTYLVEVKGSSVAAAGAKTAFFEFLGIGGSLLAGYLADRFFTRRKSIVNIAYMVLLTVAVLGFWAVPKGHPGLDALLLGMVGFLVYGPQMMVGVCAAEASGRHAAGTANGLTGFFGYMGSILSGVGTGYIVQHYGWTGGFALFGVSSILGTLFFLPTVWGRASTAANQAV